MVRVLSDSVGVSIVVISALDDDVAAINRLMRDAGHAAACAKATSPDELETELTRNSPDLILFCQANGTENLPRIAKMRDQFAPKVPILIVARDINEDTIARVIQMGARDAISLENTDRFKAVASRELRTARLEKALSNVSNSANQYRQELNKLKQITVEAIADIQEGIIVSANPAWLELFGFDADTDLEGHPVMDLCVASDRPALKGGLVACERKKWQNDKLKINGQRDSGGEFPVEFNLERITHDDAVAVRMVVMPEQSAELEMQPEVIVEQAINRDPITGLYTRQEFFNSVNNRLKTQPKGGVRALACIRPDRFAKAINDVGVIGSEKIIRQLAQILREFMQPGDIYGRFGGTIFTVLLERGTMNDVESWAELLLKNISATVFDYENHSTVVTCSVGVCEAGKSSADAAKPLLESDDACRMARQKGGNRIELSRITTDANKARADDSTWGPRIRAALTENRMRLEHQPIGSLNQDIEGAYDTLVRMLDEDGNTILPSEFMPAAERTGLSKAIDRWVIGASFSFCKANPNDVNNVFVRLSAESLLDETLLDWLVGLVNETGVKAKRICFEVSEEIVVKHLRQTTNLASELSNLGFRFAVEHFGTTHDSSHLLNIVPMRFVKIDGSLMQGLHKDTALQNKIKSMVTEAKQKNIQTIAERVQDANTMAVLWQLGISFIQGNYVQNREIVIESMGTATLKAKLLESVS